ncbi:MAG TPA: ribbon-helix-helix protein, CopG family [Solirubrobacterales bacterium]
MRSRKKTTTTTSLRLDRNLAENLAAVARAEGRTISDVVREAVGKHIAELQQDREFKQRLAKRLEEDREVLERLAE